jgi:hypothetical protein
MIARVRTWLNAKLLDWAQATVNRYGLSVVKLQQVAGTTYLIDADGSARRLDTPKRRAGT